MSSVKYTDDGEPPLMALDLEEKMKALIDGYEHLDKLSSKLPSNVLNMAAKYAKNMVGDETLLCPKDLEELEKQHQSLSKVRQDLQAMAYERVVIDVLSRDAILNAKRNNHRLKSRSSKSRFQEETSNNLDCPIPVSSYPHAPKYDSVPVSKAVRTGATKASSGDSHAKLSIGTLPNEIQGLHTKPDNASSQRTRRTKLKQETSSKKYRSLKSHPKVPFVNKAGPDPETLLTYALAANKQDNNSKTLEKLLQIQGQQANEIEQMRILLKEMAMQKNEQSMDADKMVQHIPSNQAAAYASECNEVDSSWSSDEGEDFSGYKIMTVSKHGFKSVSRVSSTCRNNYNAGDMKDPDVLTKPLKRSFEKTSASDMEFELVVEENSGNCGWVPRAIHSSPITDEKAASSYTPANVEDGEISGQYFQTLYESDEENDSLKLIVVDGAQLSQRQYHVNKRVLRDTLEIDRIPSPQTKMCDSETFAIKAGNFCPRSQNYTSRVIPLNPRPDAEIETPNLPQNEKEDTAASEVTEAVERIESEASAPHSREAYKLEVCSEVDNVSSVENQERKELGHLDSNLIYLLQQLVETQQTTMQGHNDLILTMMNQQAQRNESPPQPASHSQSVQVGEIEAISTSFQNEEIKSNSETSDPDMISTEPPLPALESPQSATSLGRLLRKGSETYAKTPSDVLDSKRKHVSTRIMNEVVKPYYDNNTNNSALSAPICYLKEKASDGAARCISPATKAIAGVLVGALKEYSGKASIDSRSPREEEGEDRKYFGDTCKVREYSRQLPPEQRGQQYPPSRPMSTAWVDVKLPRRRRCPTYNRDVQNGSVVSSEESWDEDSQSSMESRRPNERNALRMVESRNVRTSQKWADPAIRMLQLDMDESHRNQSAMLKDQDCSFDSFEKSADETSACLKNSSDDDNSSLGSYRPLNPDNNVRSNKRRGFLNKNRGSKIESIQRSDGGDDQSTTSSINLPTPLCSNILPCSATAYYSATKRDPPKESFAAKSSGRSKSAGKSLLLGPKDENHFSDDSNEDFDWRQQIERPCYRPTLSDYEPSTPSSSFSSSSNGSELVSRNVSAMRKRIDVSADSDSQEIASRDSSAQVTDSSLAESFHNIYSDTLSSSDDTHYSSEPSGTIGRSKSSKSSVTESVNDSSSYDSSSSLEDISTDFALPRAQLKLWRPSKALKTKSDGT